MVLTNLMQTRISENFNLKIEDLERWRTEQSIKGNIMQRQGRDTEKEFRSGQTGLDMKDIGCGIKQMDRGD